MMVDKHYVEFPGGKKIDIMDINDVLLLEEMVVVNENYDISLLKSRIKTRVDSLALKLEEYRGPVKDVNVKIGCDRHPHLKSVQGPVFEELEDRKTKTKYIRYARSVEFV